MDVLAVLQPLGSGAHDGLKLWWVDLDQHPDFASSNWLSPAELARAGRFRFERDAARYKTGRALLRGVLAAHLGCTPSAVSIDTGEHGKPFVVGGSGLHFNLSHSANLALLGLGECLPIGVDVESPAHVFEDFESTARVCFTQAELVELQTYPAAQRFAAFLRGWTRKEACLKAIGTGLSVEPTRVDAGLGTARREVSVVLDSGTCRLSVESITERDAFAGAFALVHPDSVRLAG